MKGHLQRRTLLVAHPKMLKKSSFLQLLFWEVTFHPIINHFSPPKSRTWRSRQRSSAALSPRSYRRSSRTWSFPRWMCRQSLGRWMGFRKDMGRRFFSPFWEGTGGWIMMDPMFWEDGEAIGCSFIRMIQCTKEIWTTSDSPRNWRLLSRTLPARPASRKARNLVGIQVWMRGC